MSSNPAAPDNAEHTDKTSRQKQEKNVSTHADALRKALMDGTKAVAVMLVLSAILWFIVQGMPGLWGALLGSAIGGFFLVTTAAAAVATARSSVFTTGAVILGTWLVKIVIVLGAVAILKRHDFYDRTAFVVTLVLVMLVVLALETRAVVTARIPSVETNEAAE